ncbi:unnamed protein product, partial [Polarella glacialis]
AAAECPLAAEAAAHSIATRCPVVNDDVPEFTVDVPCTRAGDRLPGAISSQIFDAAGQCVGHLDAAACVGRLTLLCAFDPA